MHMQHNCLSERHLLNDSQHVLTGTPWMRKTRRKYLTAHAADLYARVIVLADVRREGSETD